MKKIAIMVLLVVLGMTVIMLFNGFVSKEYKYIEFTYDKLPESRANLTPTSSDQYKYDDLTQENLKKSFEHLDTIDDQGFADMQKEELENKLMRKEKSIQVYSIVNKIFETNYTYENTFKICQPEWDFLNFLCNTLQYDRLKYSDEEYDLIEWYLFDKTSHIRPHNNEIMDCEFELMSWIESVTGKTRISGPGNLYYLFDPKTNTYSEPRIY